MLLPGAFNADSRNITLEKKNNALAVPIQAVNQQRDRNTVYVVTPANKVEVRPVTLGIQTATDAEVLSGLERRRDRSWSATAAV